ncbi:MAG: hypothetical protein CL908_15995 [Deltaproteobacteria bacterium]|nr:hypothetical protein [Deltaproteobacteria bacterium]
MEPLQRRVLGASNPIQNQVTSELVATQQRSFIGHDVAAQQLLDSALASPILDHLAAALRMGIMQGWHRLPPS